MQNGAWDNWSERDITMKNGALAAGMKNILQSCRMEQRQWE